MCYESGKSGFSTWMFVLHWQGALNFEEKSTRNNAHEVVITTKSVLRHLASLLSVPEEDLQKALCFRVVAAGGDVVNKGHTEKEAVFAKDAFAKVGWSC